MAMCFRDRTYCSSPCGTDTCGRKFTEADRLAAINWWRNIEGEPPVCFSPMKTGCEAYTPPVSGNNNHV